MALERVCEGRGLERYFEIRDRGRSERGHFESEEREFNERFFVLDLVNPKLYNGNVASVLQSPVVVVVVEPRATLLDRRLGLGLDGRLGLQCGLGLRRGLGLGLRRGLGLGLGLGLELGLGLGLGLGFRLELRPLPNS